jgi:hypothetical protein
MKREYAVVETLILVLVIVNVKLLMNGTIFMVNVVVLKLILTYMVFVIVMNLCRESGLIVVVVFVLLIVVVFKATKLTTGVYSTIIQLLILVILSV